MRAMVLERVGAPLVPRDANQALDDLRAGRFEGAMVLMMRGG